MRDIKFRAWDYTSNVMRNDISSIGYKSDGSIAQIDVISGTDILFPDKEAILMQFTGLLDKNGVEIYEGDIVKDPRRVTDHQHIEVFWSENLSMFMIRNNRKTWSEELYPHIKRYEVIGNIYENPNLLKDRN